MGRKEEPLALLLARWADRFQPQPSDLELAQRALVDTLAVAIAAKDEPVLRLPGLEGAALWATAAHALDYDDLHLPSTAHLSAVCLPAALAAGGGARAYLAGAGVMARLGTRLGWDHYTRGWHATCTAGASAAAVAAGVAAGLDEGQLACAIALALPAAGGVQRAFGTMAKPLQVGFAAAAGLRAASLAGAGATADVSALDSWLELVGGGGGLPGAGDEAIPGGVALKVYPCCYALQRPIAAVAALGVPAAEVVGIRCQTPACSLQPLIHHRPRTGLEGKFSLEYGIAAAILDHPVAMASFTDECVRRPEAQRLAAAVRIETTPGGSGLLEGAFTVEIRRRDGTAVGASLDLPPGAPGRPPLRSELNAKLRDCCGELAGQVSQAGWAEAAGLLSGALN